MPENAGKLLMFHILKEWHHFLTYPVVIATVGGPKDLATFSLRFGFSCFHILLGRRKTSAMSTDVILPIAFFVGLFFTFLALFPVKLSWQSLLQFLQNVRCQCPGFEGVQQYRNSTEITRVGAHKFDL